MCQQVCPVMSKGTINWKLWAKHTTRFVAEPLVKDHCVSGQLDDGQHLFTVRTENSGKFLRQAVEIFQEPVLMTRLKNAISPTDALAINVRYHKPCWTTHIFHILGDEVSRQAYQCKYMYHA